MPTTGGSFVLAANQPGQRNDLRDQGENEAAILHLEKYLELEPEGPQAATATGILDYLKKN